MKKLLLSVVIACTFLVWTVMTNYEATRATMLPLMLITVIAIAVVLFNGALIFNSTINDKIHKAQ